MGSYLSNTFIYVAYMITFNMLRFRNQLRTSPGRLAKKKYTLDPLAGSVSELREDRNHRSETASTTIALAAVDMHEQEEGFATPHGLNRNRIATVAVVDNNELESYANAPNATSTNHVSNNRVGNIMEGVNSDAVLPPRSMKQLLMDHEYALAVITCAVSFAGMGGLMNATPLAMKNAGHSFSQTTTALELHMVSMFLPAIFVGDVINRFGVIQVILFGMFCLMLSCGLYFVGDTFEPFVISYFLVGTGWSFAFVAGTRLLTSSYRPNEQTKAVAFSEAMMMGSVALPVMVASVTLTSIGWHNMLCCYLVLFGLMLLLVIIYFIFYPSPQLSSSTASLPTSALLAGEHHEEKEDGTDSFPQEGVPQEELDAKEDFNNRFSDHRSSEDSGVDALISINRHVVHGSVEDDTENNNLDDDDVCNNKFRQHQKLHQLDQVSLV
eukprot:m.138350 g.138350  ORF g.138350 m.138350 type:complete len:439 (-) comp14112_c0_seq1:190-1506(-)